MKTTTTMTDFWRQPLPAKLPAGDGYISPSEDRDYDLDDEPEPRDYVLDSYKDR